MLSVQHLWGTWRVHASHVRARPRNCPRKARVTHGSTPPCSRVTLVTILLCGLLALNLEHARALEHASGRVASIEAPTMVATEPHGAHAARELLRPVRYEGVHPTTDATAQDPGDAGTVCGRAMAQRSPSSLSPRHFTSLSCATMLPRGCALISAAAGTSGAGGFVQGHGRARVVNFHELAVFEGGVHLGWCDV